MSRSDHPFLPSGFTEAPPQDRPRFLDDLPTPPAGMRWNIGMHRYWNNPRNPQLQIMLQRPGRFGWRYVIGTSVIGIENMEALTQVCLTLIRRHGFYVEAHQRRFEQKQEIARDPHRETLPFVIKRNN